jgi:hypothetical protein
MPARKLGSKRPHALQGLKASRKLAVGQVMPQNWAPSCKLVINWKVGTPWFTKRGGVLSHVINVSIVGFLQYMANNTCEGNACYPSRLAKKDQHIGECIYCQLQVKGHHRGIRVLGIKEAILEGLLVGQRLDFLLDHIVQSSTPLKVYHMCLTQKAWSLRRVTDSSEIWKPWAFPPGFLIAWQISLIVSLSHSHRI